MERWRYGTFNYSYSTTPPSKLLTNANQIWDLFEGKHLFYGNDADGKGYSTRAHLVEVIGILGRPPADILKRGIRSKDFFAEDGKDKQSTLKAFEYLKVASND